MERKAEGFLCENSCARACDGVCVSKTALQHLYSPFNEAKMSMEAALEKGLARINYKK